MEGRGTFARGLRRGEKVGMKKELSVDKGEIRVNDRKAGGRGGSQELGWLVPFSGKVTRSLSPAWPTWIFTRIPD